MVQERLNALLLLYLGKDICLNYEAIIDVYARRQSRKMIFTKPSLIIDIVKFGLFEIECYYSLELKKRLSR